MRMSLTRGRAVRLGAAVAVAVAAGAAGLLGIASATAAPTAAAQPDCKVSISKQFFGMADSGPYGGSQKVFRFTLTNAHCMQVRIITYGAIVQSIRTADRRGHFTDVVLGFKTLADYVNLDSPPPASPNFGGPYFGETIGRYANRIGGLVQAERDDLHAAGQQRSEHPARRFRRLGEPRLAAAGHEDRQGCHVPDDDLGRPER